MRPRRDGMVRVWEWEAWANDYASPDGQVARQDGGPIDRAARRRAMMINSERVRARRRGQLWYQREESVR